MYTVAMIGAGSIIGYHLVQVEKHPETQLCAVADIVLEKAQKAAQPYNAAAFSDYLEMLDTVKPNLVIINLPHALHETAAVACAERGIHTLLEKPMSVSYASCQRINAAFEKSDAILQIGHVQRYMPDVVAAREIIESGELGEMIAIHETRNGAYFTEKRPRWFFQKKFAGGGIWNNLGAHSMDRICCLTGSRVAELTGKATYSEAAEVDAGVHAFAVMENGVTCSLCVCGHKVHPLTETKIDFAKGSMCLHMGGELLVSRNGGSYESIDLSKYPDPFAAQWDTFVRGVHQGHPLCCGGEYGAHILKHIESVWTPDKRSE